MHQRAESCVARRITELCVDDHRGDPAVLDGWLENKTAANVRSWIKAPGNFTVVAQEAIGICGVASLSTTGRILLCYVLPDVQYPGAGRALLRSVEEEQARVWGPPVLSLESTVSARGGSMLGTATSRKRPRGRIRRCFGRCLRGDGELNRLAR
jgi:hypothetical protein